MRGDNLQRSHVPGARVNVANGGGTATSTISGRTTTAGVRVAGLSYVNAELSGQNFAGRNLNGIDFTNATAERANFARAQLVGATLVNAELGGADLRGANLRNADVTNVEWGGARLDGATWVDGRVCAAGSTGRCR